MDNKIFEQVIPVKQLYSIVPDTEGMITLKNIQESFSVNVKEDCIDKNSTELIGIKPYFQNSVLNDIKTNLNRLYNELSNQNNSLTIYESTHELENKLDELKSNLVNSLNELLSPLNFNNTNWNGLINTIGMLPTYIKEKTDIQVVEQQNLDKNKLYERLQTINDAYDLNAYITSSMTYADYINIIDELVLSALEKTPIALTSIQPNLWSIDTSYSINDEVIYNDKKYKCIYENIASDENNPELSLNYWKEIKEEA